MIDLTNLDEVRALQINMRTTLSTDQGKEVIKFLEELCGWYDFSETDSTQILIKTGKRQVLATIKTLLELTPSQIVQITGEQNG